MLHHNGDWSSRNDPPSHHLFIIFSLLFVTPAWAETVLYCQEELATGVIKKNGRWQTGDFELKRHTVRFDEKKMTLEGMDRDTMYYDIPFSLAPDRVS